MAEKKNQHYLPQFYLRYFSTNKKQISLFNLYNELYISNAPIKNQSSKDYFYGKDGVLEDLLGKLEQIFADIINKIIVSKQVPSCNSEDYLWLLRFITLTILRNPISSRNFQNIRLFLKDKIKSIDGNFDIDKEFPNFTDEYAIKQTTSNFLSMADEIKDLHVVLSINNTEQSFITSDFPVVKYNQFLSDKFPNKSNTGFGVIGLQIFLPLNKDLMLIFYDSKIYKIGSKKQNIIQITNIEDIKQLNILQFVNCFQNVYFENISQQYIINLFLMSKKYTRANNLKAKNAFLSYENDNNDFLLNNKIPNLLIFSNLDCFTNLNLTFIKFQKRSKKIKFKNNMSHLRKDYYFK